MSSSQIQRAVPLLATLGLGTGPIGLLATFRQNLALDNLHLVLCQLLILVVCQVWFKWASRSKPATAQPAIVRPAPLLVNARPSMPTVPEGQDASEEEVEREHPLYPSAVLDDTLARMIALADPDALSLFDAPLQEGNHLQLADWTTLHEEDHVLVQAHPTRTGFYAVTSHFKNLPLRSMWELLICAGGRSSYDSMTEQTEQLERIGPLAKSKQHSASVDYIALKSMWPVGAKDLVLLSVYAELPPTLNQQGQQLRRLLCASRSIEHPDRPPQQGYARMAISSSGFLLREDGMGGCILTQINDLSSLGTWIPAKIVRLVTTKLIPRTILKMAAAAQTMPWSQERQALKELEWLPPTLNAWRSLGPQKPRKASQPHASASEARTLSAVESQLRVIVSRLGQLEEHLADEKEEKSEAKDEGPSAPVVSTWWPAFLVFNWSSKTRRRRRPGSEGGDLGLMLRTSFVSGLAGGVMGAAVVAGVMMWARRKR